MRRTDPSDLTSAIAHLKRNADLGEEILSYLLVSFFLHSNTLVTSNELLLSWSKKANRHDKQPQFDDGLSRALKRNMTLIDLVLMFERVQHLQSRRQHGVYYTPEIVKKYILQNLLHTCSNSFRIADLSCGSGSFLISTSQVLSENYGLTCKEIFEVLHGYDIQPSSIERSKVLLSVFALLVGEDAKVFHFNLKPINSLTLIRSGSPQFDFIVGNPPYITNRHISSEVKDSMQDGFESIVGNPDLYILFIELAYKLLKPGGRFGLLTMNTFFKSLNGRFLRRFIQKENYGLKIVDFKSAPLFKGTQAYTSVLFGHKQHTELLEYCRGGQSLLMGEEKGEWDSQLLNTLDWEGGWNLSLSSERLMINLLENSGDSLETLFHITCGIATLKNRVYIFTPQNQDQNYFYFQKNDQNWKVERSICQNIINPSKIHKQQEVNIHNEQIIYPYFIGNDVKIIPESFMKSQYPFAYKYLRFWKEDLSKRDKGDASYEEWYAFGRRQNMVAKGNSILLPHISDHPRAFTTTKPTLIYNGILLTPKRVMDLKSTHFILNSNTFWKYIQTTSKPYSAGFFSFSKLYIKNFTIPKVSCKSSAMFDTSFKEHISAHPLGSDLLRISPTMEEAS